MKKILFFHFDLQGGGAEKVLVNLISHLDPSKYDITLRVLFGVGHYVKHLPTHVHYRPVFKKQFRGLSALLKFFSGSLLYRLFVKEQYDIEIAYLETLPTRIIGYSTNANSKKLAWVHTTMNENYQHSRAFRNAEETTKCYNNFDRVLFVSQGTLEAFSHFLPNVNTPKAVIHNINDYDKIKQLAGEPIEDGLFTAGHCNICSVGRLTTVKGFDRLIRAFSRVMHENEKIEADLFIIGQGEHKEALEHLIAEEGMSQHIHLMGFQRNPYKYMAKMDLFVCSSIIEGYSTVATESVSLGVPVLTTDCSGMNEILHNGKFGLIVENNEESLYQGLKQLSNSPDLIQNYRDAIDSESNYTTQAIVQQYEQLFDAL